MDTISIYDMFSPIHLAYLKRCAAKGLDVTADDLDSIERGHPAAGEDPLFIEYRERAVTGRLRRRPGRKPITTAGRLRRWAARFAIEDRAAEIWVRRREGTPRGRADRAPCLEAAELVSREFRFNITWKMSE